MMVLVIAILYLGFFAAIFAGFAGWVFNLIDIFTMPWDPITGELILHVVGVPIPIIGAIMGWL